MSDNTFDKTTTSLAGTTSRRKVLRLFGGGLVGGAMAGTGFAAVNNAAAQTGGGLTAPIEGTLEGNAFSGLLQVTQFFNQGGVLSVVGNILNDLGDVVSGFTATVTDAQGSCEILDLTIGAIDLDLLGLVITTSPIELNITAEQGSGNLLGNLLCAVAGLLDRGGPVQGLVGLLNNILRNLG